VLNRKYSVFNSRTNHSRDVLHHLKQTLDSRLIYSVTNTLKQKLHWNKNENEEWIHFGTGKEIDNRFILNKISEHFKNDEINIVYSRTKSGLLKEHQDLFQNLLGNKNFFLWNTELNKAMEFNYVGILRYGQINRQE
jgi:predicted glutamine amidotransferase